MEKVTWSMTLAPGGKWSGVVGRGSSMRLTALEAGGNVSMLIFSADDCAERYNMPDTLKAQHTSHLTRGHTLMSDNGRVLAAIVEDSLGWHDPLSGFTTREGTDAKYGITRYQELRNEWLRSGEENLTVELFRSGLRPRDLGPVVNLFSKVSCDESGAMTFHSGHCKRGAAITLRAEMDILLLLSNTPNPLDPNKDYPSVPVLVEVGQTAGEVGEDDYCVQFRPENRRAYENTWSYYALRRSSR
ncbi:urea amidolyase associated protein UAAP1 [Paenibacillus sp. PL2-23]|uniref:urea amidolyase associated protein UAAP1 n=1 Tax=Paenibacillus sp. PL2-23 TaxID=2100729 RepID=UPI0030F57C76